MRVLGKRIGRRREGNAEHLVVRDFSICIKKIMHIKCPSGGHHARKLRHKTLNKITKGKKSNALMKKRFR
jgi:hypothetical protein